MIQSPTLFDETAALTAADEAVAQGDVHSDPSFQYAALAAIHWCARRHAEFTSDDVWARMEQAGGVPSTGDNRALGAVFRQAAREGVIATTDRVVRSARVRLHGSPRRVWRSQEVRR